VKIRFGIALIAVCCAAQTAHYGHAADGALLPDHKATPGVSDPRVTQANVQQTVCRSGYTSDVRNVPESEKRQAYAEYGVKPSPGKCCEVDHLISLELGGANDLGNLWPQPYEPRPGAHEKDVVENFLKRQVCAGRMGLAEAQQQISADWTLVYERTKGAGH